jgi:drug/metabolite transporter (DMT)-like permease
MPQVGMDAQHANGGASGSTLARARASGEAARNRKGPGAMPECPTDASARTALPGIACGAGAALFWAFGFVAARHGIAAGFAPADLVFHRFVWAGLAFLPLVARRGDLGDVGWGRSLLLTATGGPPLALFSYAGFLFVPLAHGGVIQPSCAALGGLTLATLVLGEKLPARRALGAAVIVAGLAVIGAEAFATIGTHGLAGDLSFVTAGLLFATFATLLRRWRIAPTRAAAVTSVVALIDIPIQWLAFGFERMIGLGLMENLLQVLVQGIFAGAGATYLFARSVVLLGAGRAAVFPSLVPGFTLMIGALALAEMPSAAQLSGFAVVMLGFWLTQRP